MFQAKRVSNKVVANELRKAQSTNPLKLLQDVSIFFMLERFLILIESFKSFNKASKIEMLITFEVAIILNEIMKLCLNHLNWYQKIFAGKNL